MSTASCWAWFHSKICSRSCFGELKDEFDLEVPEMTPLPGGNWSVAGSIELRKLGEVLGPHNLALGDSAEPTLNRLVLRKLGRVPRAGERFRPGQLRRHGGKGARRQCRADDV